MPVAEIEVRPRKPVFQLKSAEAILDEIEVALEDNSPKSAAARSIVLGVMRRALADARKSAEADLMATGHGTRCAINICNAEDEIIRAIHLYATRDRKSTRLNSSHSSI